MGDGSLSQNEIDALLMDADDIVSVNKEPENEAEGNTDKELSPESISPVVRGLLNSIADSLNSLINSDVSIQLLSAGLVDEDISASTGEYETVAATFSHGTDQILLVMSSRLAYTVAHLVMGTLPEDIPGYPGELGDAETSKLSEFFNIVKYSMEQYFADIPDGTSMFTIDKFYGDEADSFMAAEKWDLSYRCGFISNVHRETDLVNLSFNIYLNGDMAQLFDEKKIRERILHEEENFIYEQHPAPLPLFKSVKQKVKAYSEEKGKTAFKKKNIIEFYKTGLNPDEKKFVAGDLYADSETRSGMRKIISVLKEVILSRGDSIYNPENGYGNDIEKYRFPISLLSEKGITDYSSDSTDVERCYKDGDSVELLLGRTRIAEGKVVSDSAGRLSFEIKSAETDNRDNRDFSVTRAAFDFPINISVSLGEKNISSENAAALTGGSIIQFDKYAGEPADVYLDDYGLLIAKGEVVAVEENFGFRVVDMASMNISAALEGKFIKSPPMTSGPSIPVKIILGRKELFLKDLFYTGEGSIFELDRNVLEPAELLIGDDIRLEAEIVVIDEFFAARVIDENKKIPSDAKCEETGSETGSSSFYAEASSEINTSDSSEEKNQTDECKTVFESYKPFDFINPFNLEFLTGYLCGEHPQVAALVISCLEPVHGACILSMLPHNVQYEVTKRIAEMRSVPLSVIKDIESVIQRKINTYSGTESVCKGGIDPVVKMINNVDRGTEKIIIEALEEEDPELAEEIKSRLFAFEDIIYLDDRSVQKVMSQIDTQDLAKALKGASAEVQEKIFKNMSKRAGTLLKEDMDFMGPVLQADVEHSQQKIINIIRKLETSGDIIVARIGEEELIV